MEYDGTFTGETVADPQGLNIPIRYTGVPLKDAKGRIVGALEHVVDISDLRFITETQAEHAYLQGEVANLVAALERAGGRPDGTLQAQRDDAVDSRTAVNALIAQLRAIIGQAGQCARRRRPANRSTRGQPVRAGEPAGGRDDPRGGTGPRSKRGGRRSIAHRQRHIGDDRAGVGHGASERRHEPARRGGGARGHGPGAAHRGGDGGHQECVAGAVRCSRCRTTRTDRRHRRDGR